MILILNIKKLMKYSRAIIYKVVKESRASLGVAEQMMQEAALTGELLERSRRPDRLLMRGAGRGCRALVASAMAQRDKRPLLVVVPTLEEAGRWTALLELMGLLRKKDL